MPNNTLLAKEPYIHISHKDFQVHQAWTISPLFPELVTRYNVTHVRWVLFLQPLTEVNCRRLVFVISAAERHLNAKWIGYPLKGNHSVYPNFASGFAMSLDLMSKIITQQEKLSDNSFLTLLETKNTALDLAELVFNVNGTELTAEPFFCNPPYTEPLEYCATYPKPSEICGAPIPESSIFFVVQTNRTFRNRTDVIKNTWAKHLTYVKFYDDKTDAKLVDKNSKYVLRGECSKTVAMLRNTYEEVKEFDHIQWIFLASDSTILNIRRLLEVLKCYRGGQNIMMLGERNGFVLNVRTRSQHFMIEPFDYLSMGGGQVISVRAAALMSQCKCGSLLYPGDVALGACAYRLNLRLTHSSLFHQERPEYYPQELLKLERQVSFRCESKAGEIFYRWFNDYVHLSHAGRVLRSKYDG